MRIGVGVLLVCTLLSACARFDRDPEVSGTLRPSITESSPLPTTNPDNRACSLLTSEERHELVGYAMDAEVPVRPDPGTEECVWVHSLRGPARSAIRVVAFSAAVWSQLVLPQMRQAMVRPTTGKKLRRKLKAATVDIATHPDDLPSKKVCAYYLLLAESRGATVGVDQVAYMQIGSMPAAFSLSCSAGVMTMAGYGEYGILPSIALNRSVVRLTEQASERAVTVFGSNYSGSLERAAKSSASPSASPSAGESPSPEPDEAATASESTSPEPAPTETASSDAQ